MSLITTEVKDNIFYIQLHGRIDSSNAAPVEEEINSAFERDVIEVIQR